MEMVSNPHSIPKGWRGQKQGARDNEGGQNRQNRFHAGIETAKRSRPKACFRCFSTKDLSRIVEDDIITRESTDGRLVGGEKRPIIVNLRLFSDVKQVG